MAEQITKHGNRNADPAAQSRMRPSLTAKERAEKLPDGGVAALPAAEICGRLDNLKRKKVCEFAALLSKRLKDGDMVSQKGFAAACERLISDLGSGFDERNEPVGSYLVGYKTRLLRIMASDITKAVFGSDN